MARKKTMFGKTMNKKISAIIDITSPTAAKEACTKLNKRKDIGLLARARGANLAANRAKAMLKRKHLSSKERSQMSKVSKIYKNCADRLFVQYEKR